jgi:hypothetical protein
MQGLASAGQCHVQGRFAFAYGAWRGVRDHLIEFEILKKVPVGILLLCVVLDMALFQGADHFT